MKQVLDLLSSLSDAGISFSFYKIRQLISSLKVLYVKSIYFSLKIFRIFLHYKADS